MWFVQLCNEQSVKEQYQQPVDANHNGFGLFLLSDHQSKVFLFNLWNVLVCTGTHFVQEVKLIVNYLSNWQSLGEEKVLNGIFFLRLVYNILQTVRLRSKLNNFRKNDEIQSIILIISILQVIFYVYSQLIIII